MWLIKPHRRQYLTYQGPLAPDGHRWHGQVRRVDRGWITPRIWTEHRIITMVWMRDFRGVVEIRRLAADCYRAVPTPRWTIEP